MTLEQINETLNKVLTNASKTSLLPGLQLDARQTSRGIILTIEIAGKKKTKTLTPRLLEGLTSGSLEKFCIGTAWNVKRAQTVENFCKNYRNQ